MYQGRRQPNGEKCTWKLIELQTNWYFGKLSRAVKRKKKHWATRRMGVPLKRQRHIWTQGWWAGDWKWEYYHPHPQSLCFNHGCAHCYSPSEPKPFLPSGPSLRCTFPDIHKVHSLTALRYLYEMWPHPRDTPWLALYLKYHIPCLTYNSIPVTLVPLPCSNVLHELTITWHYLLFTVCFPPM